MSAIQQAVADRCHRQLSGFEFGGTAVAPRPKPVLRRLDLVASKRVAFTTPWSTRAPYPCQHWSGSSTSGSRRSPASGVSWKCAALRPAPKGFDQIAPSRRPDRADTTGYLPCLATTGPSRLLERRRGNGCRHHVLMRQVANRHQPGLTIGRLRTRTPVAAKIALASAGATSGTAGSPTPPGLSLLGRTDWQGQLAALRPVAAGNGSTR
jgi:hypothetical protein